MIHGCYYVKIVHAPFFYVISNSPVSAILSSRVMRPECC
jgi:hypothetical protein